MSSLKENIARMDQELAEMKAKMEQETTKSEQETTQYPIYCLSNETGTIVRFDGLKSGVIMKASDYDVVGFKSNTWTEHTYTNIWQQLPVCPKYGFYDMQPIWCWDNDYTHMKTLRFFDTKNSRPFDYNGKRGGLDWDNYAPFEGEWLDWMNEAFNTLEK